MSKTGKINLLKKLVEKGEVLCAEVCAMDWNLVKELNKIKGVGK